MYKARTMPPPTMEAYIEYGEPHPSDMLEDIDMGDTLIDVGQVEGVMETPDGYGYVNVKDAEPEFLHPRRPEKRKYQMRTRAAAMTYFCPTCNKELKYPSKINEHMRKHTGERPYLCQICGSRFSQGHVLKVHLKSHQGERPYKCLYCDKCFPSVSQKNTHEKWHLRNAISQDGDDMDQLAGVDGEEEAVNGQEHHIYLCPFEQCGLQSTSREEVEEHISVVHAGEQVWADEFGGSVEEGAPVGDDGVVVDSGEAHLHHHLHHHHHHHQGARMHQHLPGGNSSASGGVVGAMGDVVDGQRAEEDEEVEYQYVDYHHPGEHEHGQQQLEVHEMMGIVGNDVVLDEAVVYEDFAYVEEDVPPPTEEIEVETTSIHQQQQQHQLVVSTSDGSALPSSVHYEQKPSTSHEQEDIHLSQQQQQQMHLIRGGHVKEEQFELDGMEDGEGQAGGSRTVKLETRGIHNAIDGYEQQQGSSMLHEDLVEEEVHHPHHHLSAGDNELLDDDGAEYDPGDERVRVWVDPLPSRKRLSQYQMDYNMLEPNLEEVVVDARVLEMAAPKRFNYPGGKSRTRRATKPARNLDWIIDAVAKGHDVDMSSPHNRRKPKVHMCEYCGKVDKYPSKIKAHMRTHTGEKPYKCEICGMGFAQRTPMRLHVRRHLNHKPYACTFEDCNEEFVSGALLNLHLAKKHYKQRKYVCMRGCGRYFASARNQHNHERRCYYSKEAADAGYNDAVYQQLMYEEEMAETEGAGEMQGSEGGYVQDGLVDAMDADRDDLLMKDGSAHASRQHHEPESYQMAGGNESSSVDQSAVVEEEEFFEEDDGS